MQPSEARSPIIAICSVLVAARPKVVLAVAALLVAVGAIVAAGAPGALSAAGYEVTGSESTRAAALIEEHFEAGASNIVMVGTANGSVDEPGALAAGQVATELVASLPGITGVQSYWTDGVAALRSVDGRQAIIAVRANGTEDDSYDRVREIRSALETLGTDDLAFAIGGSASSNLELVEVSERDLLRAELLVFPITTIVLLIVFRTVVAALLPLIVSAIAVVGTAVALRGLSDVTLVSIFGLNLTTALGLGMAIDYSLFIINRWREERPDAPDAQTAVLRSLDTAGRSVLFSGLTTAATLAALLVFDYPLLRSLALAGFVVVGLATVGALIALPAAMYLLGDRIDAGRVRRPKAVGPVEEGRWYRLAMLIMRRPLVTIALVVALLGFVGTPFLRAEFGLPDERVLPADASSRVVAEQVRDNFPALSIGAIATYWEPPAADVGQHGLDDAIAAAAATMSGVDGVASVESRAGIWSAGERIADSPAPARFDSLNPQVPATWFRVTTTAHPMSAEGADVARAIRSLDVDGTFLVGGEPARLVDNTGEIAKKMPLVLAWIAAVISALLFMSFRSVLVPIKAFLLNLLSLTASFGALVWVFQDGRFSDILDYTPTGLTDAQTPILMFCIAFGLSMDYEVFLLSRIREEYDATGRTDHAVAAGLQQTGGIITAAAVLMAIVFFSFATGDVTVIQMVGIGLALAILVDAFIVRTLLVPAFMALAGDWNWWTPSLRQRARTPRRSRVLAPTKGT